MKERIILTVLCAAISMELFMTRVNLSFAIVKMIKIESSDEARTDSPRKPFCIRYEYNETKHNFSESISTGKIERKLAEEYPIKATSTLRGLILSVFFYFYGFSSCIGGPLVDKYGAKKVLSIILFMDFIGNFLIPLGAKTHYGILIFLRIIMGLFQGAAYPALNYLIPVWTPQDEISRFISFVFPANSFGPIFILNVGAIVMSEFGWEYVFYLTGLIGFILLLLWTFVAYDTPEKHPRISTEEKDFILQNRSLNEKKREKETLILKSMVKSLPLWAIIIAHSGNMFGLAFLITQLPIYFYSIIGVNIKKTGFLSSLPYLSRYVSANLVSWISAYLIKKSNWSSKVWQRILTVIGFGFNSLYILSVGLIGCNETAVLCFFVMAMAFKGFSSSGYQSNLIKISPLFLGTATGFMNVITFSYSCLVPLIVGVLTPDETMKEWTYVFWIIFLNYLLTGLFYIIFVSTEVQSWNHNHHGSTSDDYKNKKTDTAEALIINGAGLKV